MTKTYDNTQYKEQMKVAEEATMTYESVTQNTACIKESYTQQQDDSALQSSSEWEEVARLSVTIGLEQMRRGMGSTTAQVWEETKQMMGWK